MNNTVLPPPKSKSPDVLFLGFDLKSFPEWTIIPHLSERYRLWEMSNSFSVYHWLDSKAFLQPERLPSAIICNFSMMKKENFLFAESIKNHSILRKIPLIALSEMPEQRLAKEEYMKKGIDDLFFAPYDWDKIENRIELLNNIKPISASSTNAGETLPLFRISRSKRIFDIITASLLLIVLSPVMAIIALAVFLESGMPVIYRSKRVGTGYNIFDFFKFRSMYKDADARLNELKHLNKYNLSEAGKPTFLKLENDPRITRIGRFIRKTSLDELPQLFNVLKGDMSIVGNRPLPLYEAEHLTRDDWARRFIASAGITGLWQVAKSKKDELSAEERIGLDVEYAHKNSMKMDLEILLKTLPAMLQKGE